MLAGAQPPMAQTEEEKEMNPDNPNYYHPDEDRSYEPDPDAEYDRKRYEELDEQAAKKKEA